MKAVRNVKVCFSTDIHPFYTYFNFIYLGKARSWRILVWDQNQRRADMYISGQKLYHLSTINLPCSFRAVLIQAVTSASDIFFTLQELKPLGILSALFTLKHEESMNI